MDIRKCHKILELDYGASIDEARQSYRDLVRVWHPDRFSDNPGLRREADERLKEINLAYERITAFLFLKEKRREETDAVSASGRSVGLVGKVIWAATDLARDLGLLFYAILGGVDFKVISRQVVTSKLGFWGTGDRHRRAEGCSVGKGTGLGNGVNAEKDFSAVFEEVARAKREEKIKWP